MTNSSAVGHSHGSCPESDRWFVAVEVVRRSFAAHPENGAGERLDVPGVAQLERAQGRGLRTAVLAADRAFYGEDDDWVVDQWIECDTSDPAAILRALGELDGCVVAVTSTVDAFLEPAAVAAHALGLRGPTPGSPALANDETAVREALAAAGVAVAPWVSVCVGDPALTSAVGYPCVVSPVDGARRWDVGLVDDDGALRALADRHAARPTYGRGVRPRGRLIVEQYVHGPRYAADGFVAGGQPVVHAWSEQVMAPPAEFAELAMTATRQPPAGDAPAFVHAALVAAGYDSGPFHLEFVLGPAGPVLVGLYARPAGPGAQLCVDQVSGLDSADVAVGLLLGEALPEICPDKGVAACTRIYLMSHMAGNVRAVSGVRDAAGIPGLLVAEVFPELGSATQSPGSPGAYLGHVVATGTTPEQAGRRAACALDRIEVQVEALQTV